ncbi:MAG TPA: VOC family protein [Streptosporangiaceae bacterium]
MIRSLGYLRIESTDTGAWLEFGTKILGLTPGRGPEPGAVYLRMDDFPARFVIVPGEADRLLASGWELAGQADLGVLARALEQAGVPAKAGTPEELAARRVAGMLRFEDPSGHVLEAFWGAALDSRPAFCPYGIRFVTGDLGLGHLVIPAADDEAALEFYTRLLGFRLRDSMGLPGELFGREPGSQAMMRFLGLNARHHSLALAPMPAPSGCVHVMIEVATLDDVGRAMDRCTRRGGQLSSTLGRHANDHMVSCYLRTPAGFDIEYGTGGLLVDDATWISRQTTAVSEWGHVFAAGAGH